MDASAYETLSHDAALEAVASLESFDEAHAAAAAARARALFGAHVARAALATAFARRRARASGKFERAAVMLFTREGYEQATSSAVARHRAQRFTGYARVFDLGCGVGSDTVALARVADAVTAVDVDADALACARHNAAALGVAARVAFLHEDALSVDLSTADAAFADPARRRGGRRVQSAGDHRPPLDDVLRRARDIRGAALCVKTAPGIDADDASLREAAGDVPLEAEWVSEDGVCKEAALWCGTLARRDGARGATVISHGAVHTLDGDPGHAVEPASLGAYIGEPDPAVIRSHLVAALCGRLRANLLDRRVAFLTASRASPTPFARWYRVRDAIPFGINRLRAYLRQGAVGRLVVKTRAFPLRPEELIALLKLRGDNSATVVCTTIDGAKMAIVCEPCDPS